MVGTSALSLYISPHAKHPQPFSQQEISQQTWKKLNKYFFFVLISLARHFMEIDYYKVSLSSRSRCVHRPQRWWTRNCLGKVRLEWIDLMNFNACVGNLVICRLPKSIWVLVITMPIFTTVYGWGNKNPWISGSFIVIQYTPSLPLVQQLWLLSWLLLALSAPNFVTKAICLPYVHSNSVAYSLVPLTLVPRQRINPHAVL